MSNRITPPGFVEPCLPSPTEKPPSGDDWLHEIKHDGFRFLAWCDGYRVRLFTRRGYDWSDRYPALVRAIGTLREGPAALSESLRAGEDAVTLQGGALPAVPA